MNLARLSTLSAAIMIISAAQANEFMDDATLDIHLRNYYKNDKEKTERFGTTPKAEDSHSQWAQAIRINFSSGYFENIVGIDLGVHHSLKLRSDEGSNNGLLRSPRETNGNIRDNDSAKGYGKTSYALKVNLMDMGVAKYGRMFMNTPLLNDSDSRALPSLTEGFYSEGSFDALSLYGLIALKENAKDQSGFDDYGYVALDSTTKTSKKSVQIIGGSYDFGQGFSSNLAYGHQKDVAKRYFADVNYATNIEEVGLDFGLQYGKNSKIGDSKDYINNQANKKDTSQYAWGAKATAHIGAVTITLAYTAVEKTDMGDYQFTWGTTEGDSGDNQSMDSSDYFGYNAVQYSDFHRNGQKAWGLNANYNLNEFVEGLNIYGAYVKGKVNPKLDTNTEPESWKETEYNLGVSYYLPMVEGLSAHVLYAHNTEEEKKNSSGTATAGEKKTQDTRVIVKYDLAVF